MGNWDENTKSSKLALSGTNEPEHRAYLIVIAGDNLGGMYEVRGRMVLGRATDADVRFADDGVSRRHAAVALDADDVVIEDLNSRNGTYVNEAPIVRAVLHDGDKIRVGSTSILKFTHHDSLEERFQRHLYDAALRDGLTHVFNKKYFLERLSNEFAYARRHGTELAVMMLDIDHFKEINDVLGHLGGDHVIAGLALSVQETLRCEDVFARFGGDEFSVICRGLDRIQTLAMAERLREVVANLEFPVENRKITLTVSIGIAMLPDDSLADALALVRAADTALYAAKHAGRNLVEMHTPATDPE